jgi:hypothetical protein
LIKNQENVSVEKLYIKIIMMPQIIVYKVWKVYQLLHKMLFKLAHYQIHFLMELNVFNVLFQLTLVLLMEFVKIALLVNHLIKIKKDVNKNKLFNQS